MQLSYPELLNCYEDLKKSVNRLVKELTRNGIVVNLNPQTVEVPDIHSSIFENKYYFDGYDVLLDFTDHDMKVINEYKNSKGDKEMEKSKIVETVQMLEEENKLLKKQNKEFEDSIGELARDVERYEDAISTLRTRCTDSARDMFDKKMYGCLSVVRGRKELDCGINFDSPLDFAKSIIEHKTHVDGWTIESDEFKTEIPDHERVTFGYDELIEIAEYLLIYCKHNKEDL